MMKTLTLFIPSDWPQARHDCPWLLCDAEGRVLEQGCSTAAHWPIPAADPEQAATTKDEAINCDVILCGQQVAIHRVQLPKTPLGRTPEVIGAALEDNLLEDCTQVNFAARPIPPEGGDNKTIVGVIAKARLGAIGQLLKSVGLSPRRAWPLNFVLPAGVASLCGSELTLALPQGSFLTLDFDAGFANWLEHLAPTGITQPIPYVLLDHALAQASPEREKLLQEAHGAGQLQHILLASDALTVATGPGFLYGELSPPRQPSPGGQHFRLAARFAAGFALAAVLLSTLQWGWLNWQANNYRKEIEHSFREAFPQAAMVDPLLQMQRQIDLAQHANGRLTGDDFLRLLEPFAVLAENQLSLQEMAYEQGKLYVSGRISGAGLERLTEQSRQLGVALEIIAQRGQANELSVDLLLSARVKR